MTARILIADDEEIVVRSTVRILEGAGYALDTARDGIEALARIDEAHYDVVILDIMMPGLDGIEVLRRVKESHPDVEVIMFTGLAQIETAVSCMKLGAFDYLAKPFDPDELRLAVTRALERRSLRQENLHLRLAVGHRYRLDNMIGASPRMQQVYRLIAQCAATHTTVLITGESGTGKELIARAIHHNSLRKSGPFVAVDCTALAENLLESELFGHVKGAFTGAVAHKKGMFELAEGGTLFLDEIANISLAIQAKLLRVIQEREFRAVGDTRTQTANFRLVAATNKDLQAMVGSGAFRDDLFYRINVFPIPSPALRERREDIPALAHHFVKAFAQELGKNVDAISDGAMNLLTSYDWPGNVRELQNALHRATILATDNVLRRAHLLAILEARPDLAHEVPLTGEHLKRVKKAVRERSVEHIERLFLIEALKRNRWNVTRSASDTEMLRPNFQALMKKHNIRVHGAEADEDDVDPGAPKP
ncbi:MAG: sigma-54-dependent Fis family transcriptional regulator [Betaproteobacteria bacterium]|nr:sigma-54-dependent Fis family transcriptional regulator [Betaproteobacteria bacterium]